MAESEGEDTSQHKIISTTTGLRVSQACDRCRMKKIKCDGGPPCSKCVSTGLECTISDKLSRRSFPKGYTVNLENRVKELESEIQRLRSQASQGAPLTHNLNSERQPSVNIALQNEDGSATPNSSSNPAKGRQINNPIDQIFNLDKNGIIIGNDNLNFESQFNHLLINLHLPFLKITNSHNYLLDDPDSYLYHRSYFNYNSFNNKDLEVIYNPVTAKGSLRDNEYSISDDFPSDVYELFIKLINNFKKIFNSKRELDNQILQYFLNYNTLVPIFDYNSFMERYDAFHTMYPFMFTYDDATINGFNFSSNDYHVVNEYLIIVIQIYAMISMNDPSLNLNLLLNHKTPSYTCSQNKKKNDSIVHSLYDFLPYLNVYHVEANQLQTYLLFLFYSLLINNKEKSLLLSSLINAFIGILGVNLNCDNLFFNDLSLPLSQRRDRVKMFWSFKILLKCFNLKFGFKPTINTTVINPVTIERYFKLTPEKLSSLIDPSNTNSLDPLFVTLLAPSVEFLNLMNIVIPSSFSPNYYEYLKSGRHASDSGHSSSTRKGHTNNLDWILNDDDGDGNDGNLNYNYTQFLTIDKNLSNWRYSLQDKVMSTEPLVRVMGLRNLSSAADSSLYYRISFDGEETLRKYGLSHSSILHYMDTGQPDAQTAVQLIKIQLNFHYLLIRSMNYLNFAIEGELTSTYYVKIANISREVLAYFIITFGHVANSKSESVEEFGDLSNRVFSGGKRSLYDPFSTEIDMDEDGFIVNDFSAKRRKKDTNKRAKRYPEKSIPTSPFNCLLNVLSLTMINIKKVIVLQMLYLLICNLKISKKGGTMSVDTLRVLHESISLFIKIFINYQPQTIKSNETKRVQEFYLFKKIINDELKNEIMNSHREDSDNEDENSIDWDDENMDEDLKYLKILKFIKYKTNTLFERGLVRQSQNQEIARKQVTLHSLAPAILKDEVQPLKQEDPIPPTFSNFSTVVSTPDLNTSRDVQPFPRKIQGNLGNTTEKSREEDIANDLMSLKNSGRLYHEKWN